MWKRVWSVFRMSGGGLGERGDGRERTMGNERTALSDHNHTKLSFTREYQKHTSFPMNKVKVSKKLNILCLHGYFQSAQVMKDHIPALYRKLKSIADFCSSCELHSPCRLSRWSDSCQLHGGLQGGAGNRACSCNAFHA